MSAFTAIAFGDDYHAKPTSVGRAVIGAETIVVDPASGVRLANGENGELWIRSPGRAKVITPSRWRFHH